MSSSHAKVTVLLLLFVIAFVALAISAPVAEEANAIVEANNGKLAASIGTDEATSLVRHKRYGYGYGRRYGGYGGWGGYGYGGWGGGYGYRSCYCGYGGYGYGYYGK
ncbi:hypothetical protein niasHS_013884 [Heterodera schachtii]|uniref:Uncharacterized protein n=1 Tax=Heterodera schachtii TaxID=97005 RepID=A0ABD2IPZ6_HETSC